MRKLIPRQILNIYHFAVSALASAFYLWPSHKMVVIGITGTKGKSTTAYFLAKILEGAGYRVGLTSTAIFKIVGREWLNATKMTMLGRFALQKMLRDMVKAGCSYAIVETSSEGLAQYRHAGIDYDVAVFTNLTPEHIESHGGFENYKKAKGKLFASLAGSFRKKIGNGKKIIVANLDDANVEYFLGFWAEEKMGFSIQPTANSQQNPRAVGRKLVAQNVQLHSDGSSFLVDGEEVNLKLIGKGNVYNALAAITVAQSQGVPLGVAAEAISKIALVPGRMELIDEGQPFKVMVDYAHEPESTRQLYEAVKNIPHNNLIQVLGSTGGGRDVGRRRILGELAAENTDTVIVTTDDPYDDDPEEIADALARGAVDKGKKIDENIFIILDRREAIRKSMECALPNDLILITGKGSEQVMIVAGGRKIPHDDRKIVREEILKKYKK